jgi:hypothetical protein
MSLPYAGIVEPFESWFNVDRVRLDYYNGMDTYIFRSDINTTWQVNPEIDTPMCFTTAGSVDLYNYYPDTTGFVLQGDAVQVLDQMCDSYQLSVTTLNKTSVYNLYISRETGSPVRYQMMGYDSLIGSHFDLYQVDYLNISTGADIFPSGTFDQPMSTCGGFPGPGAFSLNPLEEMAQYFPGNELDTVVSEEYAEYMAQHGKAYGTPEEMRTREMQYHSNKHFISAHQRKYRVGQSVSSRFSAELNLSSRGAS